MDIMTQDDDFKSKETAVQEQLSLRSNSICVSIACFGQLLTRANQN
jgi:hypothetical protein